MDDTSCYHLFARYRLFLFDNNIQVILRTLIKIGQIIILLYYISIDVIFEIGKVNQCIYVYIHLSLGGVNNCDSE